MLSVGASLSFGAGTFVAFVAFGSVYSVSSFCHSVSTVVGALGRALSSDLRGGRMRYPHMCLRCARCCDSVGMFDTALRC